MRHQVTESIQRHQIMENDQQWYGPLAGPRHGAHGTLCLNGSTGTWCRTLALRLNGYSRWHKTHSAQCLHSQHLVYKVTIEPDVSIGTTNMNEARGTGYLSGDRSIP
ncbi:hypothetical protein GDO78_014111 [Eleutherodactylus coqui]|uniref:Uncharacterized protein n=1 Tax=Eleutherodactylus coqui TaxID=57060 RepID=A0A8J6EEW3_ELECQ|nr:hypothetical protein GDO78_014111 [Eleutherodactylus coqui]